MKRGLLILAILLLSTPVVNAESFDGIYDKYQAVYIPSTKVWTTGSMAGDRIVLKKKTSTGTGSYSEYYYNNGKQAIALSSNFEFIKDGRLITVNNANLKYGELIYQKGKFIEKPLSFGELQKIFPDTEIIKISQFQDGKLKIKKGWFNKKTILLLNDTKEYFHKYSFKPSNVKETDVTGLVTLKRIGIVTFSHYGEDNNKLIIYVIN